MVLTYFYWRIFVLRVAKSDTTLQSIIQSSRGLENVHDTSTDDMTAETQALAAWLLDTFGEDVMDDLAYMAQNYFDNRDITEIDMEYASRVASWFDEHYPRVAEAVDAHTSSFGFGQMDPMDQALFTLWYVEHHTLDTPKQVLMNEIIELAKRYGDSGSPKLLNGVLHHIVNN